MFDKKCLRSIKKSCDAMQTQRKVDEDHYERLPVQRKTTCKESGWHFPEPNTVKSAKR